MLISAQVYWYIVKYLILFHYSTTEKHTHSHQQLLIFLLPLSLDVIRYYMFRYYMSLPLPEIVDQ